MQEKEITNSSPLQFPNEVRISETAEMDSPLPLSKKANTATDISTALPEKPKNTKYLPMTNGHSDSFNWVAYLAEKDFTAAPVSSFKHLPLFNGWSKLLADLKVEVINTDVHGLTNAYWIASLISTAGYLACLRYQGYEEDSSEDFWINLAHPDIHDVGWCTQNNAILTPPQKIFNKQSDWKAYLCKELIGTKTLPSDFRDRLYQCLESEFKPNMKCEVVDKECISRIRPSTIRRVIAHRLCITYDKLDSGDNVDETASAPISSNEFWCHYRSQMIHEVGWATQVQHPIYSTANPDYENECLKKIETNSFTEMDSTAEMFDQNVFVYDEDFLKSNPNLKFEEGMKLEALDPLNLSNICVATIKKVLKKNYLFISFDSIPSSEPFCYSAFSPYIFPVGFCDNYDIKLVTPKSSTHQGSKAFEWNDYLAKTRSKFAPDKLLIKPSVEHGFKVGQKIEAVDLLEPNLICVATIWRIVANRLLLVHFDGWDHGFNQWLDVTSPDIFPIGYCEMIKYKLEVPPNSSFLSNTHAPTGKKVGKGRKK